MKLPSKEQIGRAAEKAESLAEAHLGNLAAVANLAVAKAAPRANALASKVSSWWSDPAGKPWLQAMVEGGGGAEAAPAPAPAEAPAPAKAPPPVADLGPTRAASDS